MSVADYGEIWTEYVTNVRKIAKEQDADKRTALRRRNELLATQYGQPPEWFWQKMEAQGAVQVSTAKGSN